MEQFLIRKKKTIMTLIGLKFPVIFFIALILVSCQPEEDTDNINDDLRDNLVKTWQCDENSQIYSKGIQSVYTVSIVKNDSSDDEVLIYNFYNLGAQSYIPAKLSGSELTIDQKTISEHIVNGTGLITNNYKKIQWTYYVDDGSGVDIDTVTAIYVPID